MGKLLTIKTDMQWPWGVPFHVADTFNGHQRGEWFFREPIAGAIRGPFMNRDEAAWELSLANAEASRV